MAWRDSEGNNTSDRQHRLPDDWPIRRVRVLRAAGYRCQARDSQGRPCGRPANQVDHIRPSGSDDYSNLEALCRWHHDRKSSAEGTDARKAKGSYRRQAREPEQHPLAQREH